MKNAVSIRCTPLSGISDSERSLVQEAPAILEQQLCRTGNGSKTDKLAWVNTLPFRGSFTVSAVVRLGDQRQQLEPGRLSAAGTYISARIVLCAWDTGIFGRPGMDKETAEKANIEIEIVERDGYWLVRALLPPWKKMRFIQLRVE